MFGNRNHRDREKFFMATWKPSVNFLTLFPWFKYEFYLSFGNMDIWMNINLQMKCICENIVMVS